VLTAARGDLAMPADVSSAEAFFAGLIARTPAPPERLSARLHAACSCRPLTDDASRDLLCEVWAWLSPMLDAVRGPWPARDFQDHALATAWLARRIAPTDLLADYAGAAWACGLLARIGQLATYSCFPKAYSRVIRQAASLPGGILAAERVVLGTDHALAGKRLAENWGWPDLVRDVIWTLHQPVPIVPPAHAPVAALVRRADQLARRAGLGWPDYTPLTATDDPDGDQWAGLDLRAVVAIMRAGAHPTSAQAAPPQSPSDQTTFPPSIASGWQEALASYLNTPVDGDVAQMCGHIARSARAALTADLAVALATDDRSGVYPAALSRTDVQPPMIRVTPETRQAFESAQQHALAGRLLLDPAPDALTTAIGLNAMLRHLPDARTHMLGLVHRNRLIGAVLYSRSPGAESKQPNADAIALLTGVYARALAAALNGQTLRQQAESIALANQHSHSTEHAGAQAARLKLLATMAAGAAHELNTPLAIIAGRAQLLERDLADSPVRHDLRIISEQAHRASAIVSELLACAKPEQPHPIAVGLAAWADRLRQHWHDASGEKPAQIDVGISDDRLVVRVDADQLDQVAHAIITNAVEAAGPGGVRIRINSNSRPTDDTIVVSIGDNGRGMTPDVLAHACDPFFSHRPAGRGRGLGLSRATRLVEINGGRMWIDSTPGQGTTVHVALPAANAE